MAYFATSFQFQRHRAWGSRDMISTGIFLWHGIPCYQHLLARGDARKWMHKNSSRPGSGERCFHYKRGRTTAPRRPVPTCALWRGGALRRTPDKPAYAKIGVSRRWGTSTPRSTTVLLSDRERMVVLFLSRRRGRFQCFRAESIFSGAMVRCHLL